MIDDEESRSQVWVTVGRRKWTLTGWKADAIGVVVAALFLVTIIVGLVTVVGWFL